MRAHAAEGLGADTDDRWKCGNTQEISTMRTVGWVSKYQHAAEGILTYLLHDAESLLSS